MLQYLILNNHIQAAKAFKNQSSLTWKQILLTSFAKGNRQQFFTIFDLLRKQQKLQFYLRVYFLIYSIHPHINVNARTNTIPQKQVISFRDFLDTKGADLAKTSQFLQFYALPFIKKPLQHGTFKTLFGKNWVSNLKEKLNVYIGIEGQNMKNAVNIKLYSIQSKGQKESIKQKHSPQQSGQPQTIQSEYQQKYRTVQKKNKQLFQQLQQIKATYHHLQQNHQQMIEDFNHYMMDSQNKWFQSYKQLVKTSRGLLEIVGAFSAGNPKIQRKYLQSKRKIEKYERFVAKKLQDLLSMSEDISVFDKPSVNEISQYSMKSGYTSKSWLNNNNNNNFIDKNVLTNNYSQLQSVNYTQNPNNITSYVQIDQYIPTNFVKLILEFDGKKLTVEEKATIIEGFSWRLLKSKTAAIRRFYCISLISNNFIGLGKVDAKSKNKDLEICTKYLSRNRQNSQLTQNILQLLNYMKADYYSRQWLFADHNIVYPLMETMALQIQTNNLQSFLIAMDILATISAYKDYRKSVLQTELPTFLLNILQSYPKMFQFQEIMSLMMTVLMNVATFSEGIELLLEYENIFSTLSIAFQYDFHDVIMMVNGFYYSLLRDSKMRQIAIQSNVPQFIRYLLSAEDYKSHERQLKFIQLRLQNKEDKNHSQAQNEQQLALQDSQNQFQQIQIDEGQIQNLQQYIRSHEHLTTKYPLNDNQAKQQEKIIQAINLQFINKIQTKKGKQNPKNSNKNQQFKIQGQYLRKQNTKKIPEQIKPKIKRNSTQTNKPEQPHVFPINKDQQIKKNQKVSKNNQQNKLQTPKPDTKTIKQQIFKSPSTKIDNFIDNSQPIPKNTKQAQFMGILSEQKNPTFAKQKNQQNFKFYSPTMNVDQQANLPSFGMYTPPPELAPEQKTRRKQLLKKLNEEIQSKQKEKVQKHKSKLQFDKPLQNQKSQFVQKSQNFGKQIESGPKAARGNIHMKIQELQKQRPLIKQKQEQRKAFQSRPKINRTPPKDEE